MKKGILATCAAISHSMTQIGVELRYITLNLLVHFSDRYRDFYNFFATCPAHGTAFPSRGRDGCTWVPTRITFTFPTLSRGRDGTGSAGMWMGR